MMPPPSRCPLCGLTHPSPWNHEGFCVECKERPAMRIDGRQAQFCQPCADKLDATHEPVTREQSLKLFERLGS